MSALLSLRGLGKHWFGVPAVTDLSLDVPEGIVLGIIGENGAGKSTLMNMIGGVTPPSAGEMSWQGAPYAPARPSDAAARGIAFIHQELNLFTNLTVAENVFIDGFPRRFGLIDRGAMRSRTATLLKRLDLDIAPDFPVERLAAGERQIVEIAKALHSEARLVIFDEPTTSLTARETARLFDIIAALKAAGTTVIYISHILGDVQRLSDRVAVLRDGRLVAEGAIAEFPIPQMIQTMIGRDLGGMYPPRTATPHDDPVLTLTGVSQPGIAHRVDLTVRRGEILGLFGLMGSGRSELARIVAGLDPMAEGQIALNGAPLAGPVRDRIARGLAFVTENRREEGLMMDAAIADNLALVAIEGFGRRSGILDAPRLRDATQGVRDDLHVRAGDIARQPVRTLSGGNQQKVVIGKWLLAGPRLFILDEPTRGVDVGAKYEIYSIADRLASEGNAILFISSELEELRGICDRIAVMRRGEVVRSFERAAFAEGPIMAAAFGEEAAA